MLPACVSFRLMEIHAVFACQHAKAAMVDQPNAINSKRTAAVACGQNIRCPLIRYILHSFLNIVCQISESHHREYFSAFSACVPSTVHFTNSTQPLRIQRNQAAPTEQLCILSSDRMWMHSYLLIVWLYRCIQWGSVSVHCSPIDITRYYATCHCIYL